MMLAAASDLLLALACMGTIAKRAGAAPRAGRVAMLAGWGVLAIAALAGAWRYAFAPGFADMHRLLSNLGAGFGLPAVVLGLLLGWRATSTRADTVVLAALATICVGAALANQPRLPGTVITLLAAVAATLLAPRAARAASALGLIALLTSAGFASQLPQTSAIVGMHVALAFVQLGWCRAALLGPKMESRWETRSAQLA